MHSPSHRHNAHIANADNRAALRELQSAIREHQSAKRAGAGEHPAPASLELASCDCAREVRVAPALLADGALVCGLCSTPFRPVAH
jgi:hypothetical protein